MPQPPAALVLKSERLLLRQPAPEEAPLALDYYRRNAAFLRPWEPRRAPDFLTLPFWRTQLARNLEESGRDHSLRLFLFRPGEEAVIGCVNFSGICRGPFQSCTLGFSLDETCQGQGLMREALAAGLDQVFRALGLHRVQANHLPDNRRSEGLLSRLGFRREGYAVQYLQIDGRWQDHVLRALRADQWPPSSRP